MDVCVVLDVWTIAWNIRWHAGQIGLQQYKRIKGQKPGISTKKISHRGHGCLCCVCCKDGSTERKVTWRTKGFKKYKNGSKGKNPGQVKKKIPPAAWMSVSCKCCVLSGRGLCDGLVPRPEESYRVWCV
jgi:hypothetical protein